MTRAIPEWIGKTDDTKPPSRVRLRVADLLDPTVECACGYDKPDDVCQKHFPLFRRLVSALDARDRAKVAEGLRMAAELTRYDTDYCDRLGGMSKMVEEPEGGWINRDAILSRAKDMEAGNG